MLLPSSTVWRTVDFFSLPSVKNHQRSAVGSVLSSGVASSRAMQHSPTAFLHHAISPWPPLLLSSSAPLSSSPRHANIPVSLLRLLSRNGMQWQDTLYCYTYFQRRSSRDADEPPLECFFAVYAALYRAERSAFPPLSCSNASVPRRRMEGVAAPLHDADLPPLQYQWDTDGGEGNLLQRPSCGSSLNALSHFTRALQPRSPSCNEGLPFNISLCAALVKDVAHHLVFLYPLRALLSQWHSSPANTASCCDVYRSDLMSPLLWLPSTVLHLGLGNAVGLPSPDQNVMPSTASTSGSASASCHQQGWEALQTIYHLQRYGLAPLYWDSLKTAMTVTSSASFLNWKCGITDGCEWMTALVSAATLLPCFAAMLAVLSTVWDRHLSVSSVAMVSCLADGKSTRQDGSDESSGTPLRRLGKISPRSLEVNAFRCYSPEKLRTDSLKPPATLRPVLSTMRTDFRDGNCLFAHVSSSPLASIPAQSTENLTSLTAHVLSFIWQTLTVTHRLSYPTASTALAADHQLIKQEHCSFAQVVERATRDAAFADLRFLTLSLLNPLTSSSPDPISVELDSCLHHLLGRAVQRAPSLGAALELLEKAWPLLPPVQVPSATLALQSSSTVENHWRHQCRGILLSPVVLQALVEHHRPIAQSISFCSFTPSQLQHRRQASCSQLGTLSFWKAVFHCHQRVPASLYFGPTTANSFAVQQRCCDTFDTVLPCGSAIEVELLNRWRRLFFGTSAVSWVEHFASINAAAMQIKERWFASSDAAEIAVSCLACIHARCCIAMTQHHSFSSLGLACNGTLAGAEVPSDPTNRPTVLTGSSDSSSTGRAIPDTLLAQHQIFQRSLTATLRRAWVDEALRSTPHGAPRQLLLRCVLATATSETLSDGPVSMPRDGNRVPVAAREAVGTKARAVCCVPFLSEVLQQWILGSCNGYSSLFPRRGDAGHLLKDILAVLSSSKVQLCPAEEAAAFQGRQALYSAPSEVQQATDFSDAAPQVASKQLIQIFRALVTEAGIRSDETLRNCELLQRPMPGVKLELQTELWEWATLLCSAPLPALQEERCVVVWVYFVMRHLEALELTKPAPPLATEAEQDGSENDHPWVKIDVALVVREVSRVLSQQLWPVLPITSILPPMLLNWLLSKGQFKSWDEAVRLLRQSSSIPEALDRPFLFLALPLDQVSSCDHADRVLKVLQAMKGQREMKCSSSMASASHHSRDQTVEQVTQCLYRRIRRTLLQVWQHRSLTAVLQFLPQEPSVPPPLFLPGSQSSA